MRHILAPALNFNGLFGNRIAVAAVAVVVGLQLLLTYLPVMSTLFGTVTVVPLVELEQLTLRRH